MTANNGLFLRAWRFTLSQLVVFLVVSGAALTYWRMDFRADVPHRTGRQLDLAIFGRGFFQLIDPATGEFRYTRDGHVLMNHNGDLLIGRPTDELLIRPQLTLPSDWTEVVITRNSTVAVQQDNAASLTNFGQIQLACFMNEEGLREVQPGLFMQTEDSGPARLGSPGTQGAGTLLQGWLGANSNRNPLLSDRLLHTVSLVAIALTLFWLVFELRHQRRTLDTLLVRLSPDPAKDDERTGTP
jgi:flagellar basal body rod protein FlgG